MKILKALAFLAFYGTFVASSSFASDELVKVKEPAQKVILTPYTFIFEPDANGVIQEKQKVDFDLTNPNQLRVGPYLLSSNEVQMNMSRERVEFIDIEFGLEPRRKLRSIYIISFTWPDSYLKTGTLELLNDKSDVLWRAEVEEAELNAWKQLKENSKKPLNEKAIKEAQVELLKVRNDKQKPKTTLMQPQTLSAKHLNSNYGHSRERFYDIPIGDIKEPFRFCISNKNPDGRVALCSKRYKFERRFGVLTLANIRKAVPPQVLVNDKSVTRRGTAVFLDYETPLKFSALIGDGTYFEFVSKPKPLIVDDIVYNEAVNQVQVIGHGRKPLGQVDKAEFSDNLFLGFLNFMPTIGDLKKYWSAAMDPDAPSLYVKGDSGVPFRQSFSYKDLPKESYRPEIHEDSKKTTYSSKVKLRGRAPEQLKLSVSDKLEVSSVQRTEGENFEWTYISDQWGENTNSLFLDDGDNTWAARYKIFRGFPGEISLRSTAVVSDSLDLVVLGEVSTQYWFEDIIGIDSYFLTQQRWGVSAKYFETLLIGNDDPVDLGIVNVAVTEAILKYRFNPGIWGRDPSVGALISYQDLKYKFREDSVDITSQNPMGGVGVFWARSMPKIFDSVFNIIPFFRYPKWVDMEAIWYPMSFESDKTQKANFAFNFHGKINWSERFFGEGGFGLKVYSYDDPAINKSIGFGMAYGTVGLGVNF